MPQIKSIVAGALAITFMLAAWATAEPVVGKAAPQFELKDVSTGEMVSLYDHQDQIVVVVFQSINCPWDRMREDGGYQRYLSPLAEKYAEKNVTFIAINSNKTESADQVASYHSQHNMPYPILKDPENKVADKYGARTTPHIYVIDGDGMLRYMGGIEKAPLSPEQCGEMDENYLVPVLNALIAGEEVPYTKTRSKGCSIKRVASKGESLQRRHAA
ncbi:redoxin domain-containing protein [Mucisphaera calidilacus]|uniref:Thiol-disulfide oxidoreductase ResA n=1 Tax=Mucisphaera calidilacus TaxID=2527982 RepID=A0A518BV09_9BACT|nr:redoxin domain-containing protein [Mucisphaera calidilacus]QDU70822.1 Thiol-disulfide oxidoreductase ResA [Mucisphaera calidilacus]